MSEEITPEVLNELNSILDNETGKPSIPVKVVIQEAENLYTICMEDKSELSHGGLDWKLVEDLPIRFEALRTSQSNWEAEYKSIQESQAEWKKISPEVFNFRDELLHHFFHALYNNPGEYAKVKRIAEGGSNADLVQDLSTLSALGNRNIAALQAINFDLNLLDDARKKFKEIGNLLAKVNSANAKSNPVLKIRNKAFTLLKQATDEIRRVGQYVYWRDEKRLEQYSSKYVRNSNSSRKKDETSVKA